MITLLAESKTMSLNQEPISDKLFHDNKPILEDMADTIMNHMDTLSATEISSILGVSGPLAVKAHSLAYEFPHKQTGYKAIEGFTGEAFKSLDISSFDDASLQNAYTGLKLISSIYGILNATDIIKPYRSEFNKPIVPGNKTAIQFFKPKVTVELVKFIKENKVADVIDLLPGDADKCVDWKIIRAFTRVHKICIQQMTPEGKLKTPIAGRLKEIRGLMARKIFIENIQNFKQLTELKTDEFLFSPEDSKPGLPVFIVD